MNFKEYFKYDFKASLAVFLVALPLCLGIALASGAPLFAGLIAGIVGGIVAGFLSESPLSVSGPAAGLTTIVALAILKLGSYEAFLLSVVLAGVIQIGLGFFKAGSVGHFFPASVVKGMLAAIGLILILKQLPHATGYDIDFEGDESFIQPDGRNTFSEILEAIQSLTPGAIAISMISLLILYGWGHSALKKYKLADWIPAPLVVVMAGISLNALFAHYLPAFALGEKHLVSVPLFSEIKNGASLITFPDFTRWQDPDIYTVAITIAIVASLETLLSIEACDKLDPYRRMTPLNRELKAQGAANFVSGLLGGLPVTSVVVRSSANIHAGARSKASSITHGIILLLAVLLIPSLLRLIPLASLAGLLLAVGFKLTEPKLYQEMYRKGLSQFLPFIVTVTAVILTDLLQGVFWGILVAVFFILKTNFGKAAILVNSGSGYLLKLTKDVSFLNKSTLRNMFHTIPPNARVLIDGSQSKFIDHDIKETIHDFMESAKSKNITVELKNITLIH
jgi:MFS superfamily sulfate permease-like transporter